MEQTALTGGAVILQVLMGVCLAACAGLRAFLPLFVLGVAGLLVLLGLFFLLVRRGQRPPAGNDDTQLAPVAGAER